MFHFLERNPFLFTVFLFITVAWAGLVTVLPNFAESAQPLAGTKPYTILQLAGRQVYIKDSCNACHSQMIRPFKSETDRYGHYSVSGEYAYDRPFLWGSKRTGPDLLRVGNYRTTDWHENHMWEPSSVVPGSIMPSYKHMFKNLADIDTAYAEALTVKKVFNVPYDADGMPKLGSLDEAKASALEEAKKIAAGMKNQKVKDAVAAGKIPEIVALIAYLNSLK
jgi:cytochrome c oxidase cbb3-type subunit 2